MDRQDRPPNTSGASGDSVENTSGTPSVGQVELNETDPNSNQPGNAPLQEQTGTNNANGPENGNAPPAFHSRARDMYHEWISSNRGAVGPSSIVVYEDHTGDSYNILNRILGGLGNSLGRGGAGSRSNANANMNANSDTPSNPSSAGVSAAASESEQSENRTESALSQSTASQAESSASASQTLSNPSATAAPEPSSTSTPTEGDTDGQIIITVNYAFSDENNPANPNRTGSLVMTIPNVASNRTPGVIDELILLATQLAYSSIVEGMKSQKGITLDKFNSFTIRDVTTLTDKNCSICFEELQSMSCTDNIKKRSRDDLLDDVKRRRPDSPAVTSEVEGESTARPNLSSSSSSSSSQARNPNIRQQLQYLADVLVNFLHVPIEIPCGHVFGKSCLGEWFKEHSTCPLCRSSVTETDKRESSNPDPANNDANSTDNVESLTGNESNSEARHEDAEQNTPREAAPQGGNVLEPPRMQTFTIFSTSTPTSIFPRFPRRASGLRPRTAAELTLPRNDNTVPERRDSPRPSETESFISSLLSIFRRPPLTRPEPLFPTMIGSRRTANGIETVQNDDAREFANLTSLINEERNQTTSNTPSSHSGNDNGNDNNDSNSGDNDNDRTNNDINNNDSST